MDKGDCLKKVKLKVTFACNEAKRHRKEEQLEEQEEDADKDDDEEEKRILRRLESGSLASSQWIIGSSDLSRATTASKGRSEIRD